MFATVLGALPWPAPATGAGARGSGGAAGERAVPDDGVLEDAVRDAVLAQEMAGLEPVSDGRLRGLRVDPLDPVAAVAAWSLAAGSTVRAVKHTIVGPYTLARRRRETAEDGPAPSSLEFAERLRLVVDALAAAGCPLVEVDEPDAVAVGTDETERATFRAAHVRLTDGAPVHLSLVLGGGNVETAGAATFVEPSYASYAVDLIAGPDNWRLVTDIPGDRGVVCGALSPKDEADEGPELLVWAAHYAASTRGRGLDRVGLANAPGLDRLPWDVARRKLDRLGEGARIAGLPPTGELAAALDPRAVNLKSRALGRHVRRRR